uniref:Dilute domain-containing protein n=1 Tax=Macrostomum lignano TaxID=282301 RepID=A0A1I8G5J4_9PLAT
AAPTGPLDDLPCGLIVQPQHDSRLIEEAVFRCSPQLVRFRLAPAYALYLTERAVFRAVNESAELNPGRLDNCLLRVADSLSAAVADSQTEPQSLVFWLANASEHLHFVKRDMNLSDLSPGTVEHVCDIIAAAVQSAFNMLLADLQDRLQADTPALLAPESQEDMAPYGGPEDEPVELQSTPPNNPTASLLQLLRCLSGAMVVLRRCRVNAALTIQLFSQLFHYVNACVFNQLVSPQAAGEAASGYLTASWGDLLLRRLE